MLGTLNVGIVNATQVGVDIVNATQVGVEDALLTFDALTGNLNVIKANGDILVIQNNASVFQSASTNPLVDLTGKSGQITVTKTDDSATGLLIADGTPGAHIGGLLGSVGYTLSVYMESVTLIKSNLDWFII